MTTTRWWAPVAEAAPLDETVRAMLTPGEDPTAELGLYLLAAHRAGAAGLTEVAKSQIASEGSLAQTLADVRRDLAPLMVDAFAPLRGATYAGLLVRDVLDDADQGALDVFRAAVAKGVPPPMAMERAAAGYGMPMREMGRFAATAADPKANPRTVEDAADRALMTYVKKTADTETEIAKAAARGPVTTTQWDEAEHPRDAGGRFTDKPGTALAPSDRVRQRLGLTGAEPKVSERQARQARQSRQARQARRAEAARSQQQTAAARAPQARPQVRPQVKAAPTITQHRSYLRSLTESAQQKAVHEPPEPKTKPEIIPDLLRPIPNSGAGPYYDIGQAVVIGADQAAGAAIRLTAGDQAMLQKDQTAMIFRVGHLTRHAGYVEQAGKTQQDAQAGLAVQQHNRGDYADPVVLGITNAELTGNAQSDRAYIESRREDLAQRQIRLADGTTRKVTDYDELNHIRAYPAYRPYAESDLDAEHRPRRSDTEIALVQAQPADDKHPHVRPVPIVEEFVIQTDARGREEGSGKHTQVELDPNQAYRIVQAPSNPPNAVLGPEQMFDVDNHVIVNRWYLAPIDEGEVDDIVGGVGKALTPVQQAQFEQLHPRDAGGRFTDKASADRVRARLAPAGLEGSTQAPHKMIRQQRRVRQARRAAARASLLRAQQVPVRAQQPPQMRSDARRPQVNPQVRQAVRTAVRSLAPAEEHLPDLPVLHDQSDYRVIPERVFQNIFEDFDPKQFEYLHAKPGRAMDLSGYEKLKMVQHSAVDSDTMLKKLVFASHDAVRNAQAPAEIYGEIEVGAVLDEEHVASRIRHAIETFEPDVLDIVERRSPRGSRIELHGYRAKDGPINLIESSPDLDLDKPLEIVYLGEHRARDITMRIGDIEGNMLGDLERFNDAYPSSIPNAPMHLYRIQNPRIRRYGVRNQ